MIDSNFTSHAICLKSVRFSVNRNIYIYICIYTHTCIQFDIYMPVFVCVCASVKVLSKIWQIFCNDLYKFKNFLWENNSWRLNWSKIFIYLCVFIFYSSKSFSIENYSLKYGIFWNSYILKELCQPNRELSAQRRAK